MSVSVVRRTPARVVRTCAAGAVVAAVLLAAPSVSPARAGASAAPSPPARSFIRSAGQLNAPRTIIVVNGGPGLDSQFTFRGLKDLASGSRRVVAYDQRGVGRTPMPQSGTTVNLDYTIDAFVADLEALRLRLGVDRIDVLGHSFGALIGAAYAATHPKRVRTLILVSGLPMSVKAQWEGDARFEQRLVALQQKGIVPEVVPELCAARGRALVPVYVGDPSRAREIGTALGPSTCDDSVDLVVNESIVNDPRRLVLERALARYQGQALVVIGARDPFGAVWADDAARPLRGAHLTKRVLPNAGHFLWLESPTFLPLLRSFLDRT